MSCAGCLTNYLAGSERVASKQGTGGQTISAPQAAALLDRSRQWFFKLVKAGYIEKQGRGKYGLVSVVRGSLAYYDDLLSKATKTAAGNRVTEARATEIELRTAERLRKLIPIEDAIAEHDILIAAVREQMDGIPARATRDLELRRKIEAEVNAAKEKIAKALTAAGKAARTGVSSAASSAD